MNRHVREYYHQFSDDSPSGNFHEVIALHEVEETPDWDDIVGLVPSIPKGWYELAKLPVRDRIDFVCGFWESNLPFHPKLTSFLDAFFESLDDIGVYITQQKFGDPYQVQLVYSLSDEGGFYHGNPPATEGDIIKVGEIFPDQILPPDFRAFLHIHDGFSKYTDTGVLPTWKIPEVHLQLQNHLLQMREVVTTTGHRINPKSLIPFYESFNFFSFQCFFHDWYPTEEMGNIFFCGETQKLSNYHDQTAWTENLAFPTFLDWLFFYLEKVAD